MQQVHTSQGLIEVYLIKHALETEGIDSIIRNEALVGAFGAVPIDMNSLPSVWVADADAQRAHEIVETCLRGGGEGEALLEEMQEQHQKTNSAGGSDEIGQSSMSDLFLLSDQVIHEPWREDLVAEIDQLGLQVGSTEPPFGVDAQTWNDIARLAAAVVEPYAEDMAEDAVVEGAARRLRDFLRNYV